MKEPFNLAVFLGRWNHAVRHDLAASDSETLPLADLLGMAGAEDLRRWQGLNLGYADPRGAPWLRAAIAARHDGLAADDVLCCAGAQEAVTCVVRGLLDPDDHAVVVLPIYQPSEQAVTTLCAATGVPLRREDGWRLDVACVAAALRPTTRLVLTNFPNSPTGASIDPDTLAELVALCRHHGLWLVNDEVYRQTDADLSDAPAMVADVYERGVSINGLSKGFGLPGLRVGWVACRDQNLLARTLRAKSMLSSCLASTSEVLAHIALRAEDAIVARIRAIGQANHRRLSALLARRPDLFAADGPDNLAFAFPRYLGRDGVEHFAARLIREAGILVMPSSIWQSPLAPMPGDHMRIALGHAKNEAALELLEDYLTGRENVANVA